jgi:hypothetical protein
MGYIIQLCFQYTELNEFSIDYYAQIQDNTKNSTLFPMINAMSLASSMGILPIPNKTQTIIQAIKCYNAKLIHFAMKPVSSSSYTDNCRGSPESEPICQS